MNNNPYKIIKMKLKLILFLCIIICCSCNFNKSVSTDFNTSLTTRGNGINCSEIYLSNELGRINNNTFTYGEFIYFNFNNVDGLIKKNGLVYPKMKLLVKNQQGDTIMYSNDLYKNSKGFKPEELQLQSHIVTAQPIEKNQPYQLELLLSDKNGEGTLSANLDFSVVHDKKILIKNEGLSCKTIYLFSKNKNRVITTGTASLNEELYLLFEGLEGFTSKDKKTALGLAIKAIDAQGRVIIDAADMLLDKSLDSQEVKSQLAPHFTFTNEQIINPITYQVKIWDKANGNAITTSSDINIE